MILFKKVKFLTAKQYLRQAYRIDELIKSNKKELNELHELSISLPATDYSKERVQSSASNDARFTSIVEKIDELERVIKEDNERLLSLKLEIRNVINEVTDFEERLLLKLRYLNFLTWEQVCDEMHVSKRTVDRIHGRALQNVKIPNIES
jgi:DNA-directed RNA polymerase specialized sigma subunit